MNAIVFLSFFLPCVSAFLPNSPAIKVVDPSTFQLPATQAAEVLDAPQTLPADAVVPPLPVQSQIVKDAMASRFAMEQKKQFMMNEDLLGKSNPMPAQAQEIKPAQGQAAAAAEPGPFYRQPAWVQDGIMGASIAGFFASMFGAAGLVWHRRKANARSQMLAAATLAGATAGATPAFAANGEQILAESTDIVSNLPMATSLEVTFAAYLAVLLGTFLPTLFLIILYLNSEARKVGDFTEEGTFS